MTQTVNKANSSVAVASSANPSAFGQSVTFTATISAASPGSGTPSGTVQFKTNGVNFGSAVTLSGGSASSAATSAFAPGSNSVTVVYSGDGNFNSSTNSPSFTQTVNKSDSATALTSSANPSVFGQGPTFTATVTAVAPGVGTPAGTVQFKTNNVNFGSPVTLSGGSATSSALNAALPVGSYTITAFYTNSDNSFSNSASASLTQTINKADTTTTLASSPNPSVFGQSVTFTATVSVVAPGAGTPTGTVIFKEGATSLGTNTLSSGQATFAITNLSVGSHSITAVYSGTNNFNVSDSTASPVTQTVNKANTTTTVASSANPSVSGQSVTFTATVNPVSPGAGTRTGTVQFQIDGTDFGSPVTLSGGTATSTTTSSLSVAGHTVTATYSGDGNFNGSDNTGSPLTQTVNKANSSVAVASSANPSTFGQAITFTATISAASPGSGTPSGTVQFKTNGVNFGSPVTLSGGSASSAATSAFAAGSNNVTVVYSGDGNFNSSTNSPSFTQTVNKADSSTTVASSVNPSVFGQSVTFTATVTAVSPGVGTPAGTVQFKTNGVSFGSPVTLSGGSATSSALSSLAAGSYSITAVYTNADGNFNNSTNSPALSQTVNKADTTTTLASSANPSVFGQSVTFTATVSAVAPGAGTPTGTVIFKEGATSLGTNILTSGQATFATTSLSVGSHSITAVYSGTNNFNASDNTASPVTQTVNKANTTTTVASSANPSVSGQSVTFTATVNPVSPGAGTRTGTVQFQIDGSDFGTPVTLSGGTATSGATSSLSVAGHTVTATYSGDGNFNGSDNTGSPLTQTVNKANSSTAIVSSANPSVFGQSVTFTATVSAVSPGVGTPSGTVQFKTNGVNFGSAVTLSGGTASSAPTSAFAIGSNNVTVVYSGDSNFNANTNSLTQTNNKASTSTTLASSLNPSVFGQQVIITATVSATAPGNGTPTGTVTFKDGTTALATNNLSAGQATFTNSAFSAGLHSITAVYNGDANFVTNVSSTLTQTVNKASSSTALASSVNPSTFGQPVVFTATVAAVSPGAGTPTGTVTFKDGATTLGTGTLAAGIAKLTNSSLSVGSHSITALYGADSNFNASDTTASPLTQTVNEGSTTTTLASSANPSVFGQSVTFTATVSPVAPSSGTPTGPVTFKDGATTLATVTLVSGQATYTTTSLSVGSHSITASYDDDVNFTSSVSSPLTQTVNKANTTTTIASSQNPSLTGNPVTWTATLAITSPGAGTPTGTMQFKVDGTNFGSAVSLSGNTASSDPNSYLASGTHTITAVYSGDSNFNTNTAANFTQTVNLNPLTAATGGTNISADATGVASTNLTGPVYTEAATADVGTGTIVLNAPAGFVFDTTNTPAPIVVMNYVTGGNGSSTRNINALADGSTIAVTRTTTNLTITITQSSQNGAICKLTWQNIRVRPSAGTPLASGNITKGTNGASMVSVTDGVSNWGTLTEVVGVASKLAFTTQPGGGRVGVILTNQPVVASQDKFGNNSTNGLGTSKTVSLTSSNGTLLGTTSKDIGTAAGAGVATFTDLRVDTASTNQLTASATGLTSTNSSAFTVAKADQTITFGTLANKTYGNAPFTVSATASSGLSVTFSIVSGPATVSGNTVTITGAGTVTVRASQVGDSNWNAATSVDQSFTVAKATLTVTADNKTRTYGAANPTLTASYTGFVNGETLATSGVTGSPALNTTATTSSTVAGSPYAITAALGSLSSANYNFVFADGTLIVTRATLTVTADNKTRVYGAPNPTLTASYSGFVNGEDQSVLSGSPTLSTTANSSSTVSGSPYTITVAQGTLAAANYTFSFVNGQLSVTIASSSVALVSSVNPICSGQSVTFTATVTAVDPATGTPSGTVVFKDGTTAVSTNVLVSGVATFTTTTLAVGAHSITAVYNGDGNFNTSTSAALTETVNETPSCLISGADSAVGESTGNIYTAPAGMTFYQWSISGSGTIVGSTTSQSVNVTAGTSSFTLTLTITNASVCGSTCQKSVGVNCTPVSISCPGNITTNTASGQCSRAVPFSISTQDGCPPSSVTVVCTASGATTGTVSSGASFNKGLTTVSCTASDAQNNVATCTFTVTVNDSQAPSITCPANITQTNDAGLCTAAVTWATPSASDNCAIASVACDPISGSSFNKGVTTVTCTATDTSDNTNACTFTVTVTDNENPVIAACPPNITQNADAGACSTAVTFTAPSASDNCPGVTVSCSPASGSTFNKGVTTVTCTATDISGNTNACTFTVTVNDIENPVIAACPENIVQGTDAGLCTAVVNFSTPTATDNCPGVTVSCNPASGTAFAKGTTIVTCTAVDTSANTNACTFTVTINDTQNPVMICPANLLTNIPPSETSAVVEFSPAATDNCPGVTFVCTPASGSIFPVGTNTVTCIATDTSDHTHECSFTITVAPDMAIANADTLGVLGNHAATVLAEKLLANDDAPVGTTLSLTAVSETSTNGGTVSLADGIVTYTPVTGFSGIDRFTYTMTDGYTTATGTVVVTVTAQTEPAANIISGPTVTQDGVSIRFAVIAGFTYQIERSSDGVTWTVIDTVVAPPSGIIDYLDTNAPAGPLYYRTSTP